MVTTLLDGFEAYEGHPPRQVDSVLRRIPEEASIKSKFLGGGCLVPLAVDLQFRSPNKVDLGGVKVITGPGQTITSVHRDGDELTINYRQEPIDGQGRKNAQGRP